MTDDLDPCTDCPALICRDGVQPYCERAAAPEQVGCTRWPPRGRGSGIPAATTSRALTGAGHQGASAPIAAGSRSHTTGKGRKGGRRG